MSEDRGDPPGSARPGPFTPSPSFHRTLLESLGEGAFGVDRDGCFTFLNPSAVRLFGFSGEAAALGANSHELTHHTDAAGAPLPASECRIYRVMDTGEPLEAWRDLFWRRDGTSFPVEVYASPLRDREDAVVGAVVTFRDVTRREAQEQELARFRAAFEASRDAVMLTGHDGFLDCNPATVALFEATGRDDLISRHPGDLSPATQPDGALSREAADARMRQAFAEGSAFFEWTHQTLGGRTFPAEVLLSRVDLADGPILQAMVRDVSEAKAARRELEMARNRAEQYFDAARVVNLVIDPDGRIQAINRRGRELLGRDREALLGRDWFADFLPAAEGERMRQVYAGFVSGEVQPGGNLEYQVIAADGSPRLLSFRNTVLTGGGVPGVLSSGEDITEQRRMEEELAFRATNDPLTGLLNRRRFEELLEQELERAERYGNAFSLVMFDVDRFKAVNDNHGHDVGDRILAGLGELVRARIRAADTAARWGGEEFMVLLPETDGDGAVKLAEALRRGVAEADFPGPGRVTISLGVIAYRAGERRRDLTKRVDDALYRAKAAGRDRVEWG
ncbi:MAG TPA: diguanylate cyclase [Gammaproteobacteria bacterium]|nr:diguanylate cyclase [Gammaproteobacteria bacterium]